MLSAHDRNDNRVIARDAVRGEHYICPDCSQGVILKQGQRVIHHFAHRPQSSCGLAGETYRHLEMKQILFDGFADTLGVELEVKTCGGLRRADLIVTIGSRAVAVECQQSAIDLDELKARNTDYNGQILWIVDSPRFFSNTLPEDWKGNRIRPRRKTPLALRYLIKIYGGLYVLHENELLFAQISVNDWMNCDGFGCRSGSDYFCDDFRPIKQPWSLGFKGNKYPIPVTTPGDDQWQ